MIKVAVTGAAGRMGSGIIRRITQQDDMEVVAAIEMPNTPLAGRDAGIQAGTEELGVEIVGSEKLEETLSPSLVPTAAQLPDLGSRRQASPLPQLEGDPQPPTPGGAGSLCPPCWGSIPVLPPAGRPGGVGSGVRLQLFLAPWAPRLL